jgi:hypothetical protein
MGEAVTATAAAVAVLAAPWEAAAAVVVLAASAASWGLVEAKWAAVVTREARRAAVVRPEARGAVAAKAALVLKAALAAATATMAEMVAAVARVEAMAAKVETGGGVRAGVCQCRWLRGRKWVEVCLWLDSARFDQRSAVGRLAADPPPVRPTLTAAAGRQAVARLAAPSYQRTQRRRSLSCGCQAPCPRSRRGDQCQAPDLQRAHSSLGPASNPRCAQRRSMLCVACQTN